MNTLASKARAAGDVAWNYDNHQIVTACEEAVEKVIDVYEPAVRRLEQALRDAGLPERIVDMIRDGGIPNE